MPPERFEFAASVRAVLFDAGNTLLWIDHARIARIAAAAGVPADERAVRVAEMRTRPALDPWLRTARRRESPETSRRYAHGIVERLGADPAAGAGAAAAAAVLRVWPELWVVPPADAAEVLDGLAARGLRVGCVSNSGGNVRSLLGAAGLAARLACVVDSGVEGVEKPDPRIFRLGCERLSAEPAATVYVGDFLSIDVEGARAAGLHGVLLDPIGAWGECGVPRAASLTEFAARL